MAVTKLHHFCTYDSDEESDGKLLSNLVMGKEVMLNDKQECIPVDILEIHNLPIVAALTEGGEHFNNIPRSINQKHKNKNIIYPHEFVS